MKARRMKPCDVEGCREAARKQLPLCVAHRREWERSSQCREFFAAPVANCSLLPLYTEKFDAWRAEAEKKLRDGQAGAK